MIGGTGDDVYYVSNSGTTILENSAQGNDRLYASVGYTVSSNIENLFLSGTANINLTGGATANTISGNSGNNILSGGGGDDIFYTGGGNDTIYGDGGNDTLYDGSGVDALIGGSGNDTYFVIDSTTVITENAGEGADTVSSSVSYVLPTYVENLWLSGSGNIDATGNGLDNYLVGNSGSNIIIGGAGNDTLIGSTGDTLIGGAGNDLYHVSSSSMALTENSGEGSDIVKATVSYTLGNYFEDLYLDTGDINGTGNSLSNSIYGSSGNNVIDGAGGNDVLGGGAGNDTLIGGSGNNTLTGGDGADSFKFVSVSSFDMITDFHASQGDKLDISQVLSGFDPLTDAIADFVKITESAGNSTLYVNTNGTGLSGDYVALATLTGTTGLTDISSDLTNHALVVS